MILAFEEMQEQPHFEKRSFRVNKKIIATLNEIALQVVVKFSAIDQSVFSSIHPAIIYPVPNKWGLQGWTIIELKKVKKSILQDALTAAYIEVAPGKLSAKYRR